MKIISFDNETFRIGPGNIAPRIICSSFATRVNGNLATRLVGNHPDESLESIIEGMLLDANARIVTHNGGYDYACVCTTFPRLIPAVYAKLLSGQATDTLWREKLLHLSTSGRLEMMPLPDGSSAKILYDLAALENRYFGRDRSGEKHDEEEGWRANYQVLDGWHSNDYPDDARQYALEDAEGTLLVYEGQDDFLLEWDMASTVTEEFRLAASFALQLMTAWGFAIDHKAVERIDAEVQARLAKVEGGLIEAGVLRPAVPSAPYASQRKRVLELLNGEEIWDEKIEFLQANGIKFTAPKRSSVNEKALLAYVGDLFKRLGRIPELTASGQIKLDAEVQDMLAPLDPVMAAYQGRESLSKLVSQLELLRTTDIVYPRYDALKETGRTSSYGNKKGTKGLYPAIHIQGVPGEIEGIDVRQAFVPRAGRALFDCDFTNLELACVGQITHDLFGESVHFTRYNDGTDLHGYLGAQLVLDFATDGVALEFVQACRAEGILSDPMAAYDAFMLCKKHTEEPVRAFWKFWRTMAKPTGLGFPGGLGPETMVAYARKTYGVTMTEAQARDFRDKWRQVYPEMPKYFDWINGQADQYNIDKSGETMHWYQTPLGMIRRGATFCSAANGKAMQSPGAEGALAALIQVSRACYDVTQGSVLYGCRPIVFLHDQIVGETTEDKSLWHDQCMAVRDIMCSAMRAALPDIKMRSDDAHLTSVWSKKSGPVYGPDGKLIPWKPEAKK